MSITKKIVQDEVATTHASTTHNLPSSPGDNSAAVTPKDEGPDQATSHDIVKRKIAADDPVVKEEAQLDDALELTFPASDPLPTTGGITRIEKPAK